MITTQKGAQPQQLIQFAQKDLGPGSMLELAETRVAVGILVTIQQRFEFFIIAPNELFRCGINIEPLPWIRLR